MLTSIIYSVIEWLDGVVSEGQRGMACRWLFCVQPGVLGIWIRCYRLVCGCLFFLSPSYHGWACPFSLFGLPLDCNINTCSQVKFQVNLYQYLTGSFFPAVVSVMGP